MQASESRQEAHENELVAVKQKLIVAEENIALYKLLHSPYENLLARLQQSNIPETIGFGSQISQALTTSIRTSSGGMNERVALMFADAVQNRLKDRPEVYGEFLNTIKAFGCG